MTTQPLQYPKLTLHTIYDPDGLGRDFSYTEGLTAHGLPELFLWARPTEGDDPGDDWIFSVNDRKYVLGMFADMLFEGRLPVGEEVVKVFDSGLSEVHFSPGEPVDPDEIDGFNGVDGAKVIPLRWSLHRAGPMTPKPLTEVEKSRMLPLIHIHAAFPQNVPEDWKQQGLPSFEPGQVYGPMTPWVLTNGASIAMLDVLGYDHLCEAVLTVAAGGCDIRTFSASLDAFARAVQRTAILDSLREPTERIVDRWAEKTRTDELWARMCASFADSIGASDTNEFREEVDLLLRRTVHGHVAACALWDVLPDGLKGAVLGPMAFAQADYRLCSPGRLTGHLWEAPDELQVRITDLLSGFDVHDLRYVAETVMRQAQSSAAFADLRTRLIAWTITGRAALEGPEVVLSETSQSALDAFVEEDFDEETLEPIKRDPDTEEVLGKLMQALTVLSAAVVFRRRLERPDVEMLIDLYEPLIPGSRELIMGPATVAG